MRLRFTVGMGCFIAGTFAAGLNTLKLAADFAAMPGTATLASIRSDQPLSLAQMKLLERASRAASSYATNSYFVSNYSLAHLLMAEKLSASPKQDYHLKQAEIAVREALQLSPADSYLWARLAYILLLRRGPRTEIVDAWRLSVLTGPVENRLLIWRILLAVHYLRPSLTLKDSIILQHQIRIANNVVPEALRKAAQDDSRLAAEVQRVLKVVEQTMDDTNHKQKSNRR